MLRTSLSGRSLATLLWLALMILGSPARADEAPLPTSPDASTHHGSGFVDPLGFLLFGPRIGVEAGTGQIAGALYGRWFDGGLLSRSMFLKQNDKFAFSYGAGLRGRYYLSDGMKGVHAGVAVEYLRTRVENDSNLTATNSTYVVPYAEGGYRMPFGQFYAGVAAALGYALKASANVENLPGGSAASTYRPSNESTFYGSASLDLGVYF
ncbi:MAG TPA: hypothetical protein VJ801_16920 [Polyangia bacterium]|jgi:hypothetical protein|nr:hypothetical protein [Polyangia bacterium]